MIPSMSREEILTLYEVDEEGRYLYLEVCVPGQLDPISFVGRKQMELSVDEIVLVKQYANLLYRNIKKE